MSTVTEVFTPKVHEFDARSVAARALENTPEEFSLEEIAEHDFWSDCWVVIYDRVYDITQFLKEHPGGADVLLEYAGRDATIAFRSTGHSAFALESLRKFYVGDLPVHQRIFRKPGGFTLSNMPA